MKSLIFLIFAGLFLISAGFSSELNKEVLSPEAQYAKLTNDLQYWVNSPLVMDNEIVFFFRGTARKILVAGDFNGWKPTLLMEKKTNSLYQAVWDERLKKGIYQYKLQIDGVWMDDPNNTNFIIDDSGQHVSFFELTEEFIPHVKYPLWIENDVYEFRYQNNRAKNVSLVGDFNFWDPFNLPLESRGSGEFRIQVRLKPGIHTYSFVVDGEWKPDPDNLRQYSDEAGNIVCILNVEQKKRK